jgi:hypothetical protein
VVKNREQRIRLGALKVRYRQAWKCKASSCELAALLNDIERLEHAQSPDLTGNATPSANGLPLCKPVH